MNTQNLVLLAIAGAAAYYFLVMKRKPLDYSNSAFMSPIASGAVPQAVTPDYSNPAYMSPASARVAV